jgi:hypothetical protein
MGPPCKLRDAPSIYFQDTNVLVFPLVPGYQIMDPLGGHGSRRVLRIKFLFFSS